MVVVRRRGRVGWVYWRCRRGVGRRVVSRRRGRVRVRVLQPAETHEVLLSVHVRCHGRAACWRSRHWEGIRGHRSGAACPATWTLLRMGVLGEVAEVQVR